MHIFTIFQNVGFCELYISHLPTTLNPNPFVNNKKNLNGFLKFTFIDKLTDLFVIKKN